MSRKLIAILRGLEPAKAVDTVQVILDAGIDWIEVPLNSPDPYRSIGDMQQAFGDRANIGAGTVLTTEQVDKVRATGATFIVSPNCNTEVIRHTKSLGMGSYPGVFSPTECFAALEAGADALKIFPAGMMGVGGLKAVRAVLPPETDIYAVGGVGPANFEEWHAAGASGYGLGSSLFSPSWSIEEVGKQARASVEAWDRVHGG